MARRCRLLCALALGLALSSPAFGQNPTGPAADGSPEPAVASPGRPPQGTPASQLLGATVVGHDHELIGAVDDLILARDGRVDAAVIGLGGFLGLGEKDVAIPFGVLSVLPPAEPGGPQAFPNGRYGGSSPERVLIPLTVEQLAAAPAFKAKAGNASVGVPSRSSGTPEGTPSKPKSSTQSGGPG